jgi:glucoamylase
MLRALTVVALLAALAPTAAHAASGGAAPGAPGQVSAAPLAWSHAQFVRLAWSIDAGHPVEQPSVVACRYARAC